VRDGRRWEDARGTPLQYGSTTLFGLWCDIVVPGSTCPLKPDHIADFCKHLPIGSSEALCAT
jgi:hypothetical protein